MIYLSFTTTPDRIGLIEPMIQSLANQTCSNFHPILWLSNYYKRSKKHYSMDQVPSFIKTSGIETRFCEDYGSNTKLYPSLKLITDSKAFIVTADDDTIYPKNWLKKLIEASENNPLKAYGYRGKIFKRTQSYLNRLLRKKTLSIKYQNTQTILPHNLSEQKTVDLLTGVWGICYRRSFFNESYFNLENCSAAEHNDDIWANGHLARNHIERVCIPFNENFSDISMEKHGVKRLWDSVNNGKGLNNKVLSYFKHDFTQAELTPSRPN